MAERHVRPVGAHNNTPDGLTYETAWLGLTSIVSSELTAGSTLYIYGRHLLTASYSLGAHGGTLSQPVSIVGNSRVNDPTVIEITGSGVVFIGNARANTKFFGLTIIANDNSALYLQPQAKNCEYRSCTFIGTKLTPGALVLMDPASGMHQNVTFKDCIFSGKSSRILRWTPTDLVTPAQLNNIVIDGCTFINCETQRAALQFFTNASGAGYNPGTTMDGIKVTNCLFQNIKGFALEISDVDSGFGHSRNIEITGNQFYNLGVDMATGGLGGAVNVTGFAKYQGAYNSISRNKFVNILGIGGAIDVFYGSYLIEYNEIDGVYTKAKDIDGNGILFDIGCDDCIARFNRIDNCKGDVAANDANSGSAVLFLQATNIQVYGNYGKGNRIGVGYGNALITRRAPIQSITFSGTTATVTTTRAHDLVTGDRVLMSSTIVPSTYRGSYNITVLNPTQFTYVMGSTPVSNATTVGSFSAYGLQSGDVFHNTFAECSFASIIGGALNGTNFPLHKLRNNIFTMLPTANLSFKFPATGFGAEENNFFYGTAKPDPNGTFTPSASSKTTDPGIEPRSLRVRPGAAAIGAGQVISIPRDASGRRFRKVPTIGAFEEANVTQRLARRAA